LIDVAPFLVRHGLIASGDVDRLRVEAGAARLDRYLIEKGLLDEELLGERAATEFGLSRTDLNGRRIAPELLQAIPAREIFRRSLLPLERAEGLLRVAVSDPFDLDSLDELRSLVGCDVEPVLARTAELQRLIKETLGLAGGTIEDLVAMSEEGDEELLSATEGADDDSPQHASVIKLVNELLNEAVNQRASDVHIELEHDGLKIRFRVDGLLRLEPMPAELNRFQAAIISRLKIMARLNIAEKRLPQDGRIRLRVSGREIDLRVSVIPMLHGEGIVLRLLDKQRVNFNLDSLTLPKEIERTWRKLIRRSHGIVLVTGPTGSGKTTTLYGTLAELRGPSHKIITVEDPVEYDLPGISQIQTHNKIGLSFAAGLRSILRHDPDVILIGEVRDAETAINAIQASLTGHLVFSTLHTNDACSAFTRLVDMGIEPYLVASTVEGVLAQRLVRRLCPHCRVSVPASSVAIPDDFPRPLPAVLWAPKGCRQCRETGYSGRVAIFELLRTDATIRQLCNARATATQIRDQARRNGFVSLRHNGWQRVLEGVTTVDEVVRVSNEDDE
jgi:general secretion pathway protein E/type IV pilus assembly protein PilB